jgi:signal transduction histidine kinase
VSVGRARGSWLKVVDGRRQVQVRKVAHAGGGVDPAAADAGEWAGLAAGVCYNRGMSTARASRWRSPYLLIALLALLLYVWGFALQVRKSRLPEDLGETAWAYPVQVAGRPAADAAQLAFLAEGWPAGAEVLLVEADGRRTRVRLERAEGAGVLAVTALSGLFFWSVAFFVFVPRCREPAVSLFFWILLLYGLAVMIGGVFYQRSPWSVGAAFGLIQVICLAVLPPLFLLLTMRFPGPQPLLRRERWVVPVLWTMAVGLVGWQAWAYGQYFALTSPEHAAELGTPGAVADIYMLAVAACGFVNLGARLRRLPDPRQARQIRWLLWGFAVGAAPYLLLRTLPQLLGLPAPLPAGADRVLEMAVPLAFVFAVVREQFLDIDVIIRRSLLYSALAAVVLALMLVPSLVVTWSFGQVRPNVYRLALLCGGLAAGLLFDPLRAALARAIDRWVFELPRDQRLLQDGLRARLAEAIAPPDVAAALEGALDLGLGCRPVSFELSTAGPDAGPDLVVAAGASDAPDLESAEFPDAWRERGFVMACAVRSRDDGFGWLLAGPRRSRRRYLRHEIALVRQAARRAAETLARLQLIARMAEEEQARRQLDELNRMKSDFLAQVAHDLRTPVTSITWSARNLLDGLAGELNEAQRDYLNSVRDAAGHLDTLVANLLDLSRLERAAVELPLAAFDPASSVAAAVSGMRPVAEAARVELVAVTRTGVRVRGNAEKLVEVLVNILDNAVKYSPPGAAVTIQDAVADGWWRLQVTDNGPGLSPGADPFGRFTQGAPSPHSARKGFGLGLYIVRQYVQLMHGEVTGDNADGGGARFTVRLPLADAD